jgi:hypothetical protein
VDEFLTQTEKYIRDITHRVVKLKAKEEAQEAAQEAIAEVRTDMRMQLHTHLSMDA